MAMPYMDLAKWKNDNTLNHRCPYCGDSQKNKLKARGYHFPNGNSFVYKCHNCGKSTSSVNFLKDNFPVIHRDYKKEWLKENGRKPRGQKMPSANIFKFKPKFDFKRTLHSLTYDAWEHSVSRSYLENRGISSEIKLRFVESMQVLSKLSPKYRDRVLGNDPRIIIPFYDEDSQLIAVSGRSINPTTQRYMTIRLDGDKPLIYNLNNIDKTQKVYVTEGPIDSFFLKNSIAVGGSDFGKLPQDIKENSVIIYDNEPRNEVILRQLEAVIQKDWSVCIWDNKKVGSYKDINDMVKSGLTSEEVTEIIDACTYRGLSAKAKFMEFKKI